MVDINFTSKVIARLFAFVRIYRGINPAGGVFILYGTKGLLV